MRTEIKRVSAYRGDRWICSYIVWLPCGCKYDRFSIVLHQVEQPTDDEILKAISEYNEDND